MNTRITQLPNGKWIGEIEVCLLDDVPGVKEWHPVYSGGIAERGTVFFGDAQRADREDARQLLRDYLSDFYGELLPEEAAEEPPAPKPVHASAGNYGLLSDCGLNWVDNGEFAVTDDPKQITCPECLNLRAAKP